MPSPLPTYVRTYIRKAGRLAPGKPEVHELLEVVELLGDRARLQPRATPRRLVLAAYVRKSTYHAHVASRTRVQYHTYVCECGPEVVLRWGQCGDSSHKCTKPRGTYVRTYVSIEAVLPLCVHARAWPFSAAAPPCLRRQLAARRRSLLRRLPLDYARTYVRTALLLLVRRSTLV
jgi:hypothetical protein